WSLGPCFLRHCKWPESIVGEQSRRRSYRRWLRAEHIVDRESRGDRGIVAGVIGAQESAREPVRADLVSGGHAEVIVRPHAGECRKRGVVQRHFIGLLRG